MISWSGPDWVFVSVTESLLTGDCPQCRVLSVLAVWLSRACSPSVDSDHSYSSNSHLKTLCAGTLRALKLQLLRDISNQFDALSDQKILLWNRFLGTSQILGLWSQYKVELPVNDACCVDLTRDREKTISLWQTRLWLLISDQVLANTVTD